MPARPSAQNQSKIVRPISRSLTRAPRRRRTRSGARGARDSPLTGVSRPTRREDILDDAIDLGEGLGVAVLLVACERLGVVAFPFEEALERRAVHGGGPHP